MKLFHSLKFIFLPCILLSSVEAAESLDTSDNSGVEINFAITQDILSNISGGIESGTSTLGNIDLQLTVDTDKAHWWSGGQWYFYLIGNYGQGISEKVGDAQGVSNIDAFNTVKLYEAWYQHQFFQGRLSFLTGLHDYNSEFYALEYAGTLLNSSFGIGPETAQVTPSIFPTTAFVMRVKYLFSGDHYIQVAMYDGIPGDPDQPHGTQIKFDEGDGLFGAFELGFTQSQEGESYYKVALGLWQHSAEFDDIAGLTLDSNRGLYLIAERTLIQEQDPEQGLGLFFQLGSAQADRNRFDSYLGIGLNYQGLVTGRNEDIVSFGIARVRNSPTYLENNRSFDDAETVYELTYLAKINERLTLQADYQYIVNPGTDPQLKNAQVFGVRLQIKL